MPFQLSSPVFGDGDTIPAPYTCDGNDISPPLDWSGAPAGTKSFALIVADPDAPRGTFLHWGVYNIPAGAQGLEEDLTSGGAYPQAHNDFGKPGYGGPCPPPGSDPHHYHFRLYALDVPALNLPDQAKVEAIERAAQPHILGTAELTGLYARQ